MARGMLLLHSRMCLHCVLLTVAGHVDLKREGHGGLEPAVRTKRQAIGTAAAHKSPSSLAAAEEGGVTSKAKPQQITSYACEL
jgi:hypothetical protein